jgi:hypothetical protein
MLGFFKGIIMNSILLIMRCIWELPQNIVGIIVWLIIRHKITRVEIIHKRLFFQTHNFGISLGSFVFWSNSNDAIVSIAPKNKEHEYGHTIQSLIFGPLYLILVGIPSISRVVYSSIYYRLNKIKWANYYNGYPENWADKLGMKHY